jgi:hypothetical protein
MLRVADRSVLARATDIVKRRRGQAMPEEVDKDIGVTKQKFPHFRCCRVEDKVVAADRKGKESATTTKTGTMSGNVTTLLRKREKRPVVDIWGEVKLPRTKDRDEPQLLRAHTRLDNSHVNALVFKAKAGFFCLAESSQNPATEPAWVEGGFKKLDLRGDNKI